MAKFGVNVVVLVHNMPLVFFYFSPKPFKKNSCTAYTMKKKIRTKLPTKKKNSCKGNFSTPLPGYLMVHPLVVRELHRHRKGVGSILAGGPIVDDVFLNCS